MRHGFGNVFSSTRDERALNIDPPAILQRMLLASLLILTILGCGPESIPPFYTPQEEFRLSENPLDETLCLSGESQTLATEAKQRPAAFDHDHVAWTHLLRRFTQDGNVDYTGWHASGQEDLGAYLRVLSSVKRTDYASWTTSQQMAFWINAYNAFTVKLILNHHPVSSIRSIGFLPGAAFRTSFIPMKELRGKVLSLNDVEHEILRKEFSEPRIHFAIVCASTSCPKLREEAYVAARLEDQLESATVGFLSDRSRNHFDRSTNTLKLSSIFDWFEEDFVRDAGSVKQYVFGYLDAADAAIIRKESTRVVFLDYDWSLNGK